MFPILLSLVLVRGFTGIEIFLFPCAISPFRVLEYHRCVSGRFTSSSDLTTDQMSEIHNIVIQTQNDVTIYGTRYRWHHDRHRPVVLEGYLNLDETIAFPTNFTLSVSSTSGDHRPQLALGYASTIARDSESFILTPSFLVLAPSRFWEVRHCIGNHFLRTQMAEGFDNWSVYSTIRIGSEWVSRVPHVYALDTGSLFTVIPDSDFVVFNGMLQSVAGRVRYSTDGISSIDECDSYIDSLPSIQFTILNSTDHGVAEILLAPTDYVTDDGSCQILVRGQTMPDDIPDSVLTIGENILRHINLSLNARDRLVGFCDPID